MNGSSHLRAIRGPVTLITIGVLFALNNFTPYGFDQTWPVLLIVFGLLSLLRRAWHRASTGAPPRAARIPTRLRRRLPRSPYAGPGPATSGRAGARHVLQAPIQAPLREAPYETPFAHRALLLLLIGALFLWRNLHPEAPIFDLVA